MTTPVEEIDMPRYPVHRKSSEDDGTVVGETPYRPATNDERARLTVQTGMNNGEDAFRNLQSPSQTREQAHRLEDDLTFLRIERQISQQHENGGDLSRNKSARTRRPEPLDDFDTVANPLHEKPVYRPPENPNTSFSKFFKKVHESSFIIRYVTYIAPLALIILIPLLLGFFVFDANVGGVRLRWFCIWLEIVWLTLWAGRILAKCIPYPIGLVSSVFTNNSKKWRDMGKQLELPATLFFWWLAIEVSFLPTMTNHHVNGDKSVRPWEKTMNKVLVAFFVAVVLNFIEKIIIQLIAISFHLRTYQDRIELNKFQIDSLTKLYKFSKEKIADDDFEFENPSNPGSGARTPAKFIKGAQKQGREALSKFGDVAGKIAGDFTGREISQSTHPGQVILYLLSTTAGGQALARRLYRTFARDGSETVHSDDLRNAFDNDVEADAAFAMFDKDMNGDISMEELEAVCVEIGRERKAITASLKDLDSVISKLDDVFMFIVVVIAILVLISLISTSAAGVLTSAGSTVLALSWLFSATAQEFLQSIIFVFVKHPFDVGDRVGIYGNTGASGNGDDYFVKEIALLYTEFKKMEGHVVQAPNSYLNTLFILNQRRSGGLAEAVPVTIKFGTTIEQIDQLRLRLLEFVTAEKREYQSNILTELRQVDEAHAITLNVVFFYKSNWQNELLRLQRRNKFICALMVTMQELGIEGPRMRYPGQKESFPVYMQHIPHVPTPDMGHGGHPDNPAGSRTHPDEIPIASRFPQDENSTGARNQSLPGRTASRPRGETLAAMGRRLDFSLGMKDVSTGDMAGDIWEEQSRPRVPTMTSSGSQPRFSQDARSSLDTARSTAVLDPSVMQRLRRHPTDSSAVRSTSHRNRFFGRGRNDDVESGMTGIPEGSSAGTPLKRLDPRTGLVSPVAVRLSDNDLPLASGAIPIHIQAASPARGDIDKRSV